MSVVTELRNTQPANSHKCEIVIINPCFNNRFYSVTLFYLYLSILNYNKNFT